LLSWFVYLVFLVCDKALPATVLLALLYLLPKENVLVVDGVEIPKSELVNIMTEQEWYSRRGSHEMSGSGGIEVAEYSTYKEYYEAMMDYLKLKYSEN